MLDGLTKHVQDRFWDRIGRVVARTGVSANAVTWLGTALLVAHAGGYLWHRRPILFAIGIALLELTDDLDGAIARVTGTASRDGAYLDAMTDRVKEASVLAALATVHDAWPPAFAALFGGMLTSYAKARAGMEIPVSNAKWPDLFERFERVAFICVLAIVAGVVPHGASYAQSIVPIGLSVLGGLTIVSAIQRFVRARALLQRADQTARQDDVRAPREQG